MFDGSTGRKRVQLSGRSRQAESGAQAVQRLHAEREQRRRLAAENKSARTVQASPCVSARFVSKPWHGIGAHTCHKQD